MDRPNSCSGNTPGHPQLWAEVRSCALVVSSPAQAQQQRLSILLRHVFERHHHCTERRRERELRRVDGDGLAGTCAGRQKIERSGADGVVEGVEEGRSCDRIDVARQQVSGLRHTTEPRVGTGDAHVGSDQWHQYGVPVRRRGGQEF